jgi:hypothetical protein
VSIPFIDLQAQRRRLGKRMDDAILKVVNHTKSKLAVLGNASTTYGH